MAIFCLGGTAGKQAHTKKLIHKVNYRLIGFIILDLGGYKDQTEPVKIINGIQSLFEQATLLTLFSYLIKPL